VDTNLIITIIFTDHENHEEALKTWRGISKAYLTLISITEIAYFLIKNKVDLGLTSSPP